MYIINIMYIGREAPRPRGGAPGAAAAGAGGGAGTQMIYSGYTHLFRV